MVGGSTRRGTIRDSNIPATLSPESPPQYATF